MTPLSPLDIQRALRPTASDAEHVRVIAADLVRELDLSAPPVSPQMVASMLGIGTITVDAMLAAAGCLLCRPDGTFEIKVRGSDPSARQRFTICHECAHTFFPGFATQVQYRCAPAARPRHALDVEGLCDLAASELLLPESFFVPDLREASFGLAGLEDLSIRYQGSLEATGHRMVSCWAEPAALLVFTSRQKPSEAGTAAPRKLRLDSVHAEGSWPFFRQHKSVLPGDVFDRAQHGEIVGEQTTIVGISDKPVNAEVHAQLYPLATGGSTSIRVIALARRVGS